MALDLKKTRYEINVAFMSLRQCGIVACFREFFFC